MNTRRRLLAWLSAGMASQGVAAATPAGPAANYPVTRTDDEWRARLTPAQYAVLRKDDTERPYTSPLNKEHRAGVFSCAGCAQKLFSSDAKFDSRTGWPSFYQPIDDKAVVSHMDTSFGMVRTEVRCSGCGGHLGHVFNDGPKPTGLRYCMNGVAMTFTPAAA